MRKREEIHKKKTKYSKRHPVSQRLVAALLCLCLSMLSLPMDDYETLVLAAQGKEILSFPALPEDIRKQQVEAGTAREELQLPENLEAVCHFFDDSLKEADREPSLQQEDMKETAEEPTESEISEETAEVSTESALLEETAEAPTEPELSGETAEAPTEPTLPEELPEVPQEPAPPEELPEVPQEPTPPEGSGTSEEEKTETYSA